MRPGGSWVSRQVFLLSSHWVFPWPWPPSGLLPGTLLHAVLLLACVARQSVPGRVQHHPNVIQETEALGVILDKGTHVAEPQCPLHKTGIIVPTYRIICWSSKKEQIVYQLAWGAWERPQSLAGLGMGAPQQGENGPPIPALVTLQRNGTVALSCMEVTVAAQAGTVFPLS